jgi:hypothetical protein
LKAVKGWSGLARKLKGSTNVVIDRGGDGRIGRSKGKQKNGLVVDLTGVDVTFVDSGSETNKLGKDTSDVFLLEAGSFRMTP